MKSETTIWKKRLNGRLGNSPIIYNHCAWIALKFVTDQYDEDELEEAALKLDLFYEVLLKDAEELDL